MPILQDMIHKTEVAGGRRYLKISLAVLAQLLAYRVAVFRGFDPDSPREIHKVTRTW